MSIARESGLFNDLTGMRPVVELTAALRESLETEGFSPALLCSRFAAWKCNGLSDGRLDWFFGSDECILAEQVFQLHRTWLPPEASPAAIRAWDVCALGQRGRRSETVLIYGKNPETERYLLLWVIRNQQGAGILAQETPEDIRLVGLLKAELAHWCVTGQSRL